MYTTYLIYMKSLDKDIKVYLMLTTIIPTFIWNANDPNRQQVSYLSQNLTAKAQRKKITVKWFSKYFVYRCQDQAFVLMTACEVFRHLTFEQVKENKIRVASHARLLLRTYIFAVHPSQISQNQKLCQEIYNLMIFSDVMLQRKIIEQTKLLIHKLLSN